MIQTIKAIWSLLTGKPDEVVVRGNEYRRVAKYLTTISRPATVDGVEVDSVTVELTQWLDPLGIEVEQRLEIATEDKKFIKKRQSVNT